MSWLVGLLLASITWGAFAFGAVYRWAHIPLLLAACLAGVVGLARRGPPVAVATKVTLAWLALVAAILTQCVPLPLSWVDRISPSTVPILRQLVIGFEMAETRPGLHPLSIGPGATMWGAACVASLGLMFAGLARGLRRDEVRQLCIGITMIGGVLAVVGIIQRANYNGLVYGFWASQFGKLPFGPGGGPFGPFINRNHFAGWMLLAIPLGLGAVLGILARTTEHRRAGTGWSKLVARAGAPTSHQVVLMAVALQLMTLSVVLTLSRSGIVGMLAGLAIIVAWISVRRDVYRTAMAVGAFVAALVLVSFVWGEAATFLQRLIAINDGLELRAGAWADAIGVFRRFPLAGTGFNTFGSSMLFFARPNLTVIYKQAHSDYLQLAAEGGILLLVPMAILMGTYARAAASAVSQEDPRSRQFMIRVGAIAGLSAIALQEAVEFSLQMPGVAFLAVVVAAIAVGAPPDATADALRRRESVSAPRGRGAHSSRPPASASSRGPG